MDKLPLNNQSSAGRNPFGRFFASVLDWLKQPNASPEQLIRWLQGFGVPAEAYGGSPAEWLYRALQGPNRAELRDKMAVRLAAFLDEQPDVNPTGKLPRDLLENAFNLAALLEERQRLASSLLAVFRRHEKQAGPLMEDLGVRVALRQALAHNQEDSELRDVWFALIRGHEVPAIAGDELAGVEGFCRMDEPSEDDVYKALLAFARAVESGGAKRRLFSKAIALFQDVIGFDWRGIRFVEQSVKHNFPEWAIKCAPNLFEQLDDIGPGSGKIRFLLWDTVAEIARIGIKAKGGHCRLTDNGKYKVVKILEVAADDAAQVRKQAAQFEVVRKEACRGNISDNEFECRIHHTIQELVETHRTRNEPDVLELQKLLMKQTTKINAHRVSASPR